MNPSNLYPSYNLFQEQWKNYSVFPFMSRLHSKEKDIYPLFHFLCGKNKNTFLLDGSERYSFFPLEEPKKKIIAPKISSGAATWKALRIFFKENPGPRLPNTLPPFYGGAVGFLSYDAGRIFEKGWKSPPPPDSLKLPVIDFRIYNDLVCFDHLKNEIYIISCLAKKKKKISLKKIYGQQKNKVLQMKNLLFNNWKNWEQAPKGPVPNSIYNLRGNNILANKDRYLKSVTQIKKYIAQGDIYQANLTQRFVWPWPRKSELFYRRLRAINPSPYSCFLRTPSYSIASCSPELLLKKRGANLETRPIAGTRPRSSNPKLDKKLQGELLLSEKERAEHIMLVDLERNDLGKVCVEGSVLVRQRLKIEKYSHVMHIVSTVTGKIKKERDFFDAVEAVSPGGTITGCPKIRCMEILDELEPVRRGIFYGAAGWIGYQGDGELNLLIRTALFQRGKIFFQVGSGIVADSQPELEFEESIHKARALLEALKPKFVENSRVFS